MLRAFSTAATGMTAQQTMVDVIANNLANVNTTGFKRSQIDFKDLLYTQMIAAGAEVAAGINNPGGVEVGNGVRVAATPKIFQLGEMENTGNPLNVAIQGDGFLQVTLPDGTIRYTRDGSLQLNANGEIVTSAGYALEPAISIPTDSVGVEIGPDGTVNNISSTGITVVGTIQLARFPNPSGLDSLGNNLFAENDASGTPTTGTPGSSGFGSLQSGFLEKSNVQMVTELVNLIKAQRAYEINSRVIRAGDDMLRTANEIVR
ncbi:MAG: flagellar basal-body rod protein FlgG [Planctomycetes bacterium]|nr:flagellar basal-body rod protein FlgG [Planctomycetota bacterium]